MGGAGGGHPQNTNVHRSAHRLQHPSAVSGAPSTEQEVRRMQEAAQNTTSRTLKDCHLEEESNLFDMVVGQIWVQYQEELPFKKKRIMCLMFGIGNTFTEEVFKGTQ